MTELPADTGRVNAAPLDTHIPALDGVRGIAILLVIQFHFWDRAFGPGGSRTTVALDEWVDNVIGVGWAGVDLFFVLSGFLITGILYDAKTSRGYLRSFYARRILRIVPCYVIFLLFVLFVLPIVPFLDKTEQLAGVSDLRSSQIWFWTYLVNVASAIKPLDATIPLVHVHFWSLAVEEQFYLVWPFVVLAFGRRTLMAICCLMVVAAFAFRFVLTAGFASDIFEINAPCVLMPARMDTLALGGLIALAYRGSELGLLRRAAPLVMVTSAAVLAGLFVRNSGLANAHLDTERYGYTFVALLFAGFLLFAIEAMPGTYLHRVLTQPVLTTFGRYSYAIYIVHLLLAFELARQFIVHRWTPTIAGSHIPLNIVFSLVATAIALGIAWVSWRVIEQPALRLKSRFRFERTAAGAAAVGPSDQHAVAAP